MGNWWAGVTTTARTPEAARASTHSPPPSIGMGTQVRPPAVSWSRRPTDPGSSTPMRGSLLDRSTSATRRLAWAKPLTTTMRSGGPRTERTRPR